MRTPAETVITTDNEYMSVTCLSGTAPATASETSTAANTITSTPVRMSSAQRMPRDSAAWASSLPPRLAAFKGLPLHFCRKGKTIVLQL
jgi:hypothetical protein